MLERGTSKGCGPLLGKNAKNILKKTVARTVDHPALPVGNLDDRHVELVEVAGREDTHTAQVGHELSQSGRLENQCRCWRRPLMLLYT